MHFIIQYVDIYPIWVIPPKLTTFDRISGELKKKNEQVWDRHFGQIILVVKTEDEGPYRVFPGTTPFLPKLKYSIFDLP